MSAASATLRGRAALASCLAFGLGILLDDHAALPAGLWAGGCVLSWATAAWAFRVEHRWGAVALLLAMGCAGGMRYHQATRLGPPYHIRHLVPPAAEGVLSGTVSGDPQLRGSGEDGRLRWRMAVDSWQADGGRRCRVTGTVLLTLRASQRIVAVDQHIVLRTRLRAPPTQRNPGGFDYRRFLALQGIHVLGSSRVEDIVAIEARQPGWWQGAVIGPLRSSARRALSAHLSGAAEGLLLGMLLGDGSAIPDPVQERFRATGLAHALVISGLHVGLVALFFFQALRLMRVPPEPAYVATTVILLLYAFITDLQPPVVRASVMAAVIMIGRAVSRRPDALNSLGLAALVLLTVWPASLLSLSFQLSFSATAAILTVYDPLCRLLPTGWRQQDSLLGKWLTLPSYVSIAAQLGTAPFVAWHFQQFAPVSLVANLIVVPLLACSVALGLLTALAGSVSLWAGMPFAASNYLILTGMMEIVSLASSVEPWPVPRPGGLFYVGAAGLAVLAYCRRPTWLLVWLLLWGNVTVWAGVGSHRSLNVIFLDVGQGDGAFIRLPNGQTMVVDAGQRSRRFDAGERVLVPFLRREGIGEVDIVVASHPHSDHIGGLVALLEQIPVRHYVDSGQKYDSWTAQRLRDLIDARGIHYHRVTAGDSLGGLGGATGLVLHPTAPFITDDGDSPHGLNNGSVTLRLEYAGRRILLTGDIEAETEPGLLGWDQRLRSDVLKAAHHGSRTSSGAEFLDAVDASVAVISVGEFNRFGHPAAQVIQRLRQRETSIYRTDECGAVGVVVEPDGTLAVHTTVASCPRPPVTTWAGRSPGRH